MNRRKFMIGAGSVGAATVTGLALSGSAAADADVEGDFDETSESITTHDGTLDSVTINADDVKVGYEGLDEEVDFVAVALSVDDENNTIVDYHSRNIGKGTDKHAATVSVGDGLSADIIDKSGYSPGDFEVDDGERNPTEVQATLTAVVVHGADRDKSVADDRVTIGETSIDSHDLSGNDYVLTAEQTATITVYMDNKAEDMGTNANISAEAQSDTEVEDSSDDE